MCVSTWLWVALNSDQTAVSTATEVRYLASKDRESDGCALGVSRPTATGLNLVPPPVKISSKRPFYIHIPVSNPVAILRDLAHPANSGVDEELDTRGVWR